MNLDSNETKKIISLNLTSLIVIVGIFWGLCWLAFGWLFSDYKGTGDAFSSINSIFSALAFAVIIYTISLQKKELSLQRKELADTRREFELQHQTLRKQRFENTFFNLLNLHHSIVEKISIIDNSGEVHNSRRAIKLVHDDFKTVYKKKMDKLGMPDITLENVKQHKSWVIEVFSEVYQRYEEYINHYIKNLVTIIRLVKTSDLIAVTERDLYYSILRSQINSYEIVLLFYHFNSGFGMHEKEFFDDLGLGAAMNGELLVDVRHSYLFDPPFVVESAIQLLKK